MFKHQKECSDYKPCTRSSDLYLLIYYQELMQILLNLLLAFQKRDRCLTKKLRTVFDACFINDHFGMVNEEALVSIIFSP